MRFIEFLSDTLVNSPLLEQALERKDARKKISDISFQLAKHMVLLSQCASSEYDTHWKTEVNAFFGSIADFARVKTKKGILPKEDLIELIWEGPLGEYSDYEFKVQLVQTTKPNLTFNEPSKEIYLELKKKYIKGIEIILDKKIPKYSNL